MTNRLALEISSYLLQHAGNPVDWYPWGSEAFDEARRRDVPIFLSVGYSTCHWCHVMARESFEDDHIASLLNSQFVSVKVDREERPDVDAVYATAVRAVSDGGGWPMSVFMTPFGAPFYVGSYWPKTRQDDRPSFSQVLNAVSGAWSERRDAVNTAVASISERLSALTFEGTDKLLDVALADDAARAVLGTAWDHQYGGFGDAPKFPRAMTIEWLLHRYAQTGEEELLTTSVEALDAMARGGIHDLLGGGFARYSTGKDWLVPHFEKMLYDNALLLPVYASAALLTGRDDLKRVAQSTAQYMFEELQTAQGVFASATDAESGGVEGSYFVWS